MDCWDDEPDRAESDPLTELGTLWAARESRGALAGARHDSRPIHPPLGGRRAVPPPPPGWHARRSGHRDAALHRWALEALHGEAGRAIDTAILGEGDLRELAYDWLWSDTFRFKHPVTWIGTEWVSIDLQGGDGEGEGFDELLDPDTPVVAERLIAPPLRRWAAANMLRTGRIRCDAGPRPRAQGTRRRRGRVRNARCNRGTRRGDRPGGD